MAITVIVMENNTPARQFLCTTLQRDGYVLVGVGPKCGGHTRVGV